MLQHWANEGEFYIASFVLLTFIEPVRLALNELVQYQISYVELAFAHPMLQHNNTLSAASCKRIHKRQRCVQNAFRQGGGAFGRGINYVLHTHLFYLASEQ